MAIATITVTQLVTFWRLVGCYVSSIKWQGKGSIQLSMYDHLGFWPHPLFTFRALGIVIERICESKIMMEPLLKLFR